MLLGLDLGTSAVKAAIVRPDGMTLAEVAERYPIEHPSPGYAESDPKDWWAASVRATRRVTGSAATAVRAIGVSGQMHGVVLVDARLHPVHPAVLWADQRSADQLDAYRALPESARQRLGNPPAVGMAGPILRWFDRHHPEPVRSSRWSLQPKDWLRLRLTGTVATDPSDASGTLLYDIPANRWAWDVVEALGLPSGLLPPISSSTAVSGTLQRRVAQELGLPAGLPVVTGAADVVAAAVGTGLVTPGPVQLVLGTGAQAISVLDRPRPDMTMRTHLLRGAFEGTWYAMAAMLNAGLALEWVRTLFQVDWDRFYAEAFSAPPGAGGISFLPYLSGERTPYFDHRLRGAWSGLDQTHQRRHLLRAALEGVAFAIRDGVDALDQRGLDTGELHLVGGGSLDRRWRGLLADVTGRVLRAAIAPAGSVQGAARLAAAAIGDAPATNPATPVGAVVAEPSPLAARYASAAENFHATYQRWRAQTDPRPPAR